MWGRRGAFNEYRDVLVHAGDQLDDRLENGHSFAEVGAGSSNRGVFGDKDLVLGSVGRGLGAEAVDDEPSSDEAGDKDRGKDRDVCRLPAPPRLSAFGHIIRLSSLVRPVKGQLKLCGLMLGEQRSALLLDNRLAYPLDRDLEILRLDLDADERPTELDAGNARGA